MQGVHEHKSRVVPGFSDRYDIDYLVWLEIHADPLDALAGEKALKKWHRDRKSG
jgi:putative endonuclease